MFTAIIFCDDENCDCADRHGLIVGNFDTMTEAKQVAKDACPLGYGWRVDAA